MNKVILMGRTTKEIDLRYTENGTAVSRFSVAVNRRFKNSDGKYEADFINCVAFGKTAEFIGNYFKKGDGISVAGRIQTGSYEKDGQKVYTTDVVVEEAYFPVGLKLNNESGNNAKPNDDEFMNIPDGIDDELPFN